MARKRKNELKLQKTNKEKSEKKEKKVINATKNPDSDSGHISDDEVRFFF